MSLAMRYAINTIIFTALITTGMGVGKHLICKSVDDIFSEAIGESSENVNRTGRGQGVQGRPGKIGPVGPPGEPGPRGIKGESGYVDCNNISETVEIKVCEGLTSIAAQLAQLRRELAENQKYLRNQLSCLGSNLLYNGTCYSIPYISESSDLTRDRAIAICQESGAELAEIHDQAQQVALEAFVRPRVPYSVGLLFLMTGMSYDNTEKAVRYRSGAAIPQTKFRWWPGHPINQPYLCLGVKRSGDGMFPCNPALHQLHGVICEKRI